VPIGLARTSLLLLGDGQGQGQGQSSTAATPGASADAANSNTHGGPRARAREQHWSWGRGRGGGGAAATADGSHLRQPLLAPIRSGEPVDLEALAAAEGPGTGAGEPAGPPQQLLLPHAQWEQQEEAAVHGSKRRQRAVSAAWRDTIPGTVACTMALFVQKMVSSSCVNAGAAGCSVNVCLLRLFACAPHPGARLYYLHACACTCTTVCTACRLGVACTLTLAATEVP